jgi:hypothetical protein
MALLNNCLLVIRRRVTFNEDILVTYGFVTTSSFPGVVHAAAKCEL